MKKNYFLKIAFVLSLILFNSHLNFSQSRGDIAFSALNVDGDDDFAIVALADIPSNSIIFFTDSDWDGISAFAASEGTISWDSGSEIIKAGTIVKFTDIDSDSNPGYGVTIGTLTTPDAGLNLAGAGDTLLAYVGTLNNPTTFITGIRNAVISAGELNGTGLGGTDLAIGVDFIEANPSTATPDGVIYSGSRSNQTSYTAYLSSLTNKTNWSQNTSDGEALLPFSKEVFTISTTNWTGATSNDWSDGANWDNGVPTINTLANIANVGLAPEITTNITANVGNLTISHIDGLALLSGDMTVNGNLTINTGSSLYLESVMTSENTIDAASIILKGTYTSAGTNQFFYFTETFHNNDDGWSLISSPTVGELVDGNDGGGNGNFAVFNGLQQSSTNYGIAIYDNSQSDSNLRWDYYSKAEVDVTSASATISMDSGIGYSIFPNSGASLDQNNGNIGFKGSFPTSDFTGGTAISITDNSGTGGNAFNFIGNPYPAFIPADNDADATNSFLNKNSSELAETTLWIWDKNPALTKGGEYIPINLTSNRFIAPAQGFFVKSKAGGGSISFTKAMQNHQTSGTFNKTQSLRPEINLIVTQNKDSKNTQILYLENKTTGFDNGYDSSIFGGETNSFSIFTKLVSDNNDSRKLGIQSLPNSGYENMVIPVGLISEANSEITFSAEVINLPNDLKVQLEDRATGRFTNLNETNYIVVLNEKQDGSGRFFIHTSQKTLSVNSDILSAASIYKINNQTLKINGLKTGNASIAIYNILGKQVLNKNLQTKNSFEVVLPNMASGVYVVKLNTKEGQLSTKIMIE